MKNLKYTIIKDEEQYYKYCNKLEILININSNQDEIELLELLIEKWDNENNSFTDLDPVELLTSMMNEHNMKAIDLVDLLSLSKGTISKMLNYHKGISKESIRKLSDYFKVSQDMFNRPYQLVNRETNKRSKKKRRTV